MRGRQVSEQVPLHPPITGNLPEGHTKVSTAKIQHCAIQPAPNRFTCLSVRTTLLKSTVFQFLEVLFFFLLLTSSTGLGHLCF